MQQTIYDQLGEPDPVVTDWGVRDRAGAVTWVGRAVKRLSGTCSTVVILGITRSW